MRPPLKNIARRTVSSGIVRPRPMNHLRRPVRTRAGLRNFAQLVYPNAISTAKSGAFWKSPEPAPLGMSFDQSIPLASDLRDQSQGRRML